MITSSRVWGQGRRLLRSDMRFLHQSFSMEEVSTSLSPINVGQRLPERLALETVLMTSKPTRMPIKPWKYAERGIVLTVRSFDYFKWYCSLAHKWCGGLVIKNASGSAIIQETFQNLDVSVDTYVLVVMWSVSAVSFMEVMLENGRDISNQGWYVSHKGSRDPFTI